MAANLLIPKSMATMHWSIYIRAFAIQALCIIDLQMGNRVQMSDMLVEREAKSKIDEAHRTTKPCACTNANKLHYFCIAVFVNLFFHNQWLRTFLVHIQLQLCTDLKRYMHSQSHLCVYSICQWAIVCRCQLWGLNPHAVACSGS